MQAEVIEKMMEKIGNDEILDELAKWATEKQAQLKKFAHSKECERESARCPADCCKYQLTPLSALFWDIATSFNDMKMFVEGMKIGSWEERFMKASKVHEILYQLTHALAFQHRADSHSDSEGHSVQYNKQYWYWDQIRPIKIEVDNWIYRFSALFEPHISMV
jgi:hypothetical protein